VADKAAPEKLLLAYGDDRRAPPSEWGGFVRCEFPQRIGVGTKAVRRVVDRTIFAIPARIVTRDGSITQELALTYGVPVATQVAPRKSDARTQEPRWTAVRRPEVTWLFPAAFALYVPSVGGAARAPQRVMIPRTTWDTLTPAVLQRISEASGGALVSPWSISDKGATLPVPTAATYAALVAVTVCAIGGSCEVTPWDGVQS
jgi:hypothetical protein